MVTGESMPVEKISGNPVTAGTVNGAGGFIMRAERVGPETLLARIVAMVGEAQRTRAPIQRIADTVAAYFVPAVVSVSIVTFIVWSVAGPQPRFAHALINAVAVLIIACPCALGLATPMSIMIGTGRGATAGVLIRNAESLEVLSKVDTLVIDKTGTLTEGKPQLTKIVTQPGWTEADVLRLAASLERASEHPIAAAVIAAARERQVDLAEVRDFHSLTGMGIIGSVDGGTVALGNAALLNSLSISPAAFQPAAESLSRDGATVVFSPSVRSPLESWLWRIRSRHRRPKRFECCTTKVCAS